MVHSHHSHSGTYCCHASTPLDEMIQTAIDKKFATFALTEHVPRLDREFIYPEESHLSVEDLMATFERFIVDARNFQKKVNTDKSNNTTLLVGFESEGGINDDHLQMCLKFKERFAVDLVVGSVHHVDGIPIDFDASEWNRALDVIGSGDVVQLYAKYFETVYIMIKTLKPEIVAHFDLIRLFTPLELEIPDLCEHKDIWNWIEKSVDLIVEMDLLVELNSSAIRKGWPTPYPKPDVFKYMISKGIKFCLSDDSHKFDQVGLNYHKVLAYLQQYDVNTVWYYTIESDIPVRKQMSVTELELYIKTTL